MGEDMSCHQLCRGGRGPGRADLASANRTWDIPLRGPPVPREPAIMLSCAFAMRFDPFRASLFPHLFSSIVAVKLVTFAAQGSHTGGRRVFVLVVNTALVIIIIISN